MFELFPCASFFTSWYHAIYRMIYTIKRLTILCSIARLDFASGMLTLFIFIQLVLFLYFFNYICFSYMYSYEQCNDLNKYYFVIINHIPNTQAHDEHKTDLFQCPERIRSTKLYTVSVTVTYHCRFWFTGNYHWVFAFQTTQRSPFQAVTVRHCVLKHFRKNN